MTEFKVEVVQIGAVLKHPNADRLELTTVHPVLDEAGQIIGGYPVLFQTGTYKAGDLACYLPVDSVVPETPEWAWLWDAVPNPPPRKRRIKAKKLRGVFSMGLLHPLPDQFKCVEPFNIVGHDLADALGIEKYVDPSEAEDVAEIKRGQRKPMPWYRKLWRRALRWLGFTVEHANAAAEYGLPAPQLAHVPGHYDIDHWRTNGARWFDKDEDVVILEKIHGQNASFVLDHEGKFHLKSRSLWRPFDPSNKTNAWAKVAATYNLESKLASCPGIILYGEAFGNFADLTYGATLEEPGFAAFDAFDSTRGVWLDWDKLVELTDMLQIPRVPVLARLRMQPGIHERIEGYAEGKTTLMYRGQLLKHLREGFVIRPVKERTVNGGQRVILKNPSESFLTRDDEKKAAKPKAPTTSPVVTITSYVQKVREAKARSEGIVDPNLSPTATRQMLNPYGIITSKAA